MRRLLILLILLTACDVKPMTSPVTSPSTLPVKRYFPFVGKNAKKPKPTRNPHYTPLPMPTHTATVTPTHTPTATATPTNTPQPTNTPEPGTSPATGVAQPSQYPVDCALLETLGVTWYYNYLPDPEPCGIEAVPMIWDERGVGLPVGGNSQWLMGFNEPDRAEQADITALEAVPLWAQVEADNPDKLLVAPSGELPWLVDWYNAFVDAYGRAPRIDAIAVHWYYGSPSGSMEDAVQHLWFMLHLYRTQADAWDVPEVWLTEFAHLYEPAAFLEVVQPDLPSRVSRYAWFATDYTGYELWAFGPDRNTSLYHDGVLTDIGQAY